jgi:hypothetical protein
MRLDAVLIFSLPWCWLAVAMTWCTATIRLMLLPLLPVSNSVAGFQNGYRVPRQICVVMRYRGPLY